MTHHPSLVRGEHQPNEEEGGGEGSRHKRRRKQEDKREAEWTPYTLRRIQQGPKRVGSYVGYSIIWCRGALRREVVKYVS